MFVKEQKPVGSIEFYFGKYFWIFKFGFLSWLQDLFFKYTWNNFLHFQVEMCVTSILNHSAHMGLHASILQNHEDKPDSDGQNSNTDAPHAPTRAALVANVITATFQL